ncbi:hypothetical protein [Aeropyrum camini]|uniref:TRAP-type uncharacterized transporter n=1 Tax=Aeropyrum camini SY1 = JCM 12091 TaxID=1198449 RepID=U3TGA3_9CREN|nr:hypothetical protein [Aeropyrum camini]BAN91065.1 TRAP-type uncharacterized transporter [Aeropyrum camini SY1 = JCM 12091]
MAQNRTLVMAAAAAVVILVILIAGYMLLGGGGAEQQPTATETGTGKATETSPTGEKTVIRWGTSRVGSSGYKALTTLAQVLNREIPRR